ncbi:DNA-deoxyinosine glycosylase [Salipaludibacillus keqinensis]|uniref:DNA-deoxyinosine glycosylase n=1 Tax=Salipaludibacillus keqinensis TaxID=2045207 RepID=UPI0026C24B40
MNQLKSMDPIIAPGANILILGSMPGEQSLKRQQYYGNPRNHFWFILDELFQTDISTRNYDDKRQFLKDKKIALWDVIASCERKGSLDSAIRDEKMNDIRTLLKNYPTIQWVGLNGTKAYDSFRKYSKNHTLPALPFKKLPSSSPVPGRNVKTFNEKVESWRELTNYLSMTGEK